MKEQLAAEANGDTRRFLDQMDSWLAEHPDAGPVVNSPEELQARTHARAHAKPPNRGKPYLVHDPIIAEIHRTREALYREREAETLVLKDEPLTKRVSSVGQVMFKDHACVVLTKNLPDEGLEAGDVGTVAHIHKDGVAYEVEFMTLTGETVAVVTVEASHVRPLSRCDRAHTRELQTA